MLTTKDPVVPALASAWYARAAAFGVVGERSACAGIMCGPAMRRFERRRNVGACAEAGVDEALRFQPFERGFIFGAALGLNQDRLVPFETKPAHVFVDPADEFGPAARLIEVFDPKQELAAAFPRAGVPEHRAVGVSEMQPSGRRRREATNLHRPPP